MEKFGQIPFQRLAQYQELVAAYKQESLLACRSRDLNEQINAINQVMYVRGDFWPPLYGGNCLQ